MEACSSRGVGSLPISSATADSIYRLVLTSQVDLVRDQYSLLTAERIDQIYQRA
jgi:hypothetical protein